VADRSLSIPMTLSDLERPDARNQFFLGGSSHAIAFAQMRRAVCQRQLSFLWIMCAWHELLILTDYILACLLLSDAFVWRLSVCLSVYLSVWRLSVAYIGPNSRIEMFRNIKISTEVVHATRDSDTTFKVKKSEVNLLLMS